MKNVKIYRREYNGIWSLEKEFDKKVSCITVTGDNYAVVLSDEDYFGKFIYLYDMNKYRITLN